MTQQFKFGDRVQDADGKQFVFLRGFLSSCTVAGDDGRTYDYLTNQLQPIPHPDTARLDWLIENQAYVVHELPDEDCAYFSVSLNAGGQIAANSTARQAIDNAMREKAA